MLSHELLIEKGFSLNEYPEGNFYEYITKDGNKMSDILGDDYMEDEEIVILQLKEDFSNKILMVDCDTWDLSDKEFIEYLNRI